MSSTTIAAGGNVTIDAYNMNLGNGVAGLSTDRIYISSDAAITTSDTVLATLTTSGTLATVSQNGYYDHQTISVTLPGNLAPGTYYIGGIADYANLLSESNEGNNTYNAVQVTVTAPQQADLSEYVAVTARPSRPAATYDRRLDVEPRHGGHGPAVSEDDRIYARPMRIGVDHGARDVDDVGHADRRVAESTATTTIRRSRSRCPAMFARHLLLGAASPDYANLLARATRATQHAANAVQVTVTAPQQPDLSKYVAVSSTTIGRPRRRRDRHLRHEPRRRRRRPVDRADLHLVRCRHQPRPIRCSRR